MEMKNNADLLAFIPYAIDREPKEMLVLMLELADGQHAVTAFGLPDGPDPAFLKSIISVVQKSEATSAAAILYTDAEGCEDGHPPRTDIIAITIVTFETMLRGVNLSTVLTVGTDGWWDWEDPETKRPLSEVTDSVLNATLIAAGHTYRRGEVVIPEPTAASMTRSLRIAMLTAKIPESVKDFAYAKGDKHFADARTLLKTLMEQKHGPSESQAEQMIAYFHHKGIRERLIGDIVNAPEQIDDYALQIAGLGDVPFSVKKLKDGMALLTNLMQYAEGEHRASVLAAYAWLKWLTGDREYVVAYIDAATELNPDLEMTKFVRDRMTEGGLPPSAKLRPNP